LKMRIAWAGDDCQRHSPSTAEHSKSPSFQIFRRVPALDLSSDLIKWIFNDNLFPAMFDTNFWWFSDPIRCNGLTKMWKLKRQNSENSIQIPEFKSPLPVSEDRLLLSAKTKTSIGWTNFRFANGLRNFKINDFIENLRLCSPLSSIRGSTIRIREHEVSNDEACFPKSAIQNVPKVPSNSKSCVTRCSASFFHFDVQPKPSC
jgi:hypothetical protein